MKPLITVIVPSFQDEGFLKQNLFPLDYGDSLEVGCFSKKPENFSREEQLKTLSDLDR